MKKGLLYRIKHPCYIKISNNAIKEFLQYMTEDLILKRTKTYLEEFF